MKFMKPKKLFDAHFHIIDARFPLIPNDGYLPPEFHVEEYLEQTKRLHAEGGAVVSGSFQGFDQTYLIAALKKLGPKFVGVTQLPATVRDEEILSLNKAGVRAVRFNLKRGGSETAEKLEPFAKRVHEVARWHVELYVDSVHLPEFAPILARLPAVSIDHLGLSKKGFPALLALAEKGCKVKATGFGRVDFDVRQAVKELAAANEEALMFGTDLPCTRAPRPFQESDIDLLSDVLDGRLLGKALYENAVQFYQPKGR